jgi:hypothetical protein
VIQYENISFPHLEGDKVVGLVTIRAKETAEITSLRKTIWKYYGGSVFFRDGSMSMPKAFDLELLDTNSKLVEAIEAHAQNNIQYTLDGVFDFMNNQKDYNPQYRVFKEYFVMCWSGQKKTVKNRVFYSRVDIALINEQVRLFYSALDEVELVYDNDSFRVVEYVNLGLNGKNKYIPLEETTITFANNATYTIESQLLFTPPQYDKKSLHHVYNSNNVLLAKLQKKQALTSKEQADLSNLSVTYVICYFNGFEEALTQLKAAKPLLKPYPDVYQFYKESLRILRKVKYS